MSAKSWLCEDAYILAQRLQTTKKYFKRPTSSIKPLFPTSSTHACLKNSSRSGVTDRHEGSTYVLYRPIEGASNEYSSILYNNCMCWKAVRENGTHTLVLRNLLLNDIDSHSPSKGDLEVKSNSSHLDIQQPSYTISDLKLTTKDCCTPSDLGKSISNPSVIDRIHTSAIIAMQARQLITSLGS